jgi:chitosanase
MIRKKKKKEAADKNGKDIVFTGDQSVLPSSALNKNYITNFTTLRKLGDQFMSDLVDSLNLGSGRPRGNQTARFR